MVRLINCFCYSVDVDWGQNICIYYRSGVMLYRCNKMGGNSWINSFHKNWIFKHNIMQINIQTNKREGRGGNKKQKNKNRTENQIKNATHERQFSVFNKLKVHPLFKWPIKENIQYWRTHSVWNEILLSLLGLQAQQQCREGDNKSLLLFYPKGAINWQRMHLKEFQISSFSSSSLVDNFCVQKWSFESSPAWLIWGCLVYTPHKLYCANLFHI